MRSINKLKRTCTYCGRGEAINGSKCAYCRKTYARWGTEYKILELTHIKHTTRKHSPSVPTSLKVGLTYFTARYPEYKVLHEPRTIGGWILNLFVFFLQEVITTNLQLHTYIQYLIWTDWKDQQKLRDCMSCRKRIGKHMEEFTFQHRGKSYNLFNLIVEQGHRNYTKLKENNLYPLPHKYDGKYTKPPSDYISLEEAISNAKNEGYGFDNYSFDK